MNTSYTFICIAKIFTLLSVNFIYWRLVICVTFSRLDFHKYFCSLLINKESNFLFIQNCCNSLLKCYSNYVLTYLGTSLFFFL